MPKFVKKVKDDDDIVVETNVPREIVQLRAEGFAEIRTTAPAKSARVEDWRAFAVDQGMAPDEAASATKATLVEQYGPKDDEGGETDPS